MKNILTKILCLSMALFCFSCNSQLCLQKRTNRLIEKSYTSSNTIYQYSVAFNNFNLVWYHKGDFIHSFRVTPYKIKKYKPIEAKNIIVNNDSIEKYFDNSLDKDVPCFWNMLDGEGIKLCVKGQKMLRSSIDTQCLFNTKFEPNSFPYKLQYDFSKILNPKYFDFENLYLDVK